MCPGSLCCVCPGGLCCAEFSRAGKMPTLANREHRVLLSIYGRGRGHGSFLEPPYYLACPLEMMFVKRAWSLVYLAPRKVLACSSVSSP